MEDKNEVKLESHSLTVTISGEEDADRMLRLASEEMRRLEKASLRGELQVIEEYPDLGALYGDL